MITALCGLACVGAVALAWPRREERAFALLLAASWLATQGMVRLPPLTWSYVAVAVDSVVVVVAAAAAFGGVYIALTGLLLVWGTRVHPERPVLGVGATFLVIALGQAAGSAVLGLVADAFTLPGAFGAAAAVLVLGAVVLPRPEHR